MAKWKITINAHGKGSIEVDGRPVPDVFGLSVVATAGKKPMLALTVKPTEVQVEGDGEVVRRALGPSLWVHACAGGVAQDLEISLRECPVCGALQP